MLGAVMKRLAIALLAATGLSVGFSQVASAADLPVKAPVYKTPPMTAPVYSWTGCYLGVNAGGGWFHKENIDTEPPPASLGTHTGSSFVGGGQIGCDYQVGQFVFGVRGLFDWADMKGQNTIPQNPLVAYTTDIRDYASLTGRVGYTIVPAALFYVQGGGAWVRDSHQQLYPQPTVFAAETQTFSGWTIGGGLEYMLAPQWSVFAEYNYANFGTKSSCFLGCQFGGLDQKLNVSTALVGVNWRFWSGH
jgi:outer membrane immunogenic protein